MKKADESDAASSMTSSIVQGTVKALFIIAFMVYCTWFLVSKKKNGQLEDAYVRKRFGGMFTSLRTNNFATLKPLL